MNVENEVLGKYLDTELKCRRCGALIEAGSYCQRCAVKIAKGEMEPEEITGTASANKPKRRKPEEGAVTPPQYRNRHRH